jgi:hypothetical protein
MEGENDRWEKGRAKWIVVVKFWCLMDKFCGEEGSNGNASARGRRNHTCSKKRELEKKYSCTAIKKKKKRDQGRLMPIREKMQKNSKPGEW